jgi:hypothetical protein
MDDITKIFEALLEGKAEGIDLNLPPRNEQIDQLKINYEKLTCANPYQPGDYVTQPEYAQSYFFPKPGDPAIVVQTFPLHFRNRGKGDDLSPIDMIIMISGKEEVGYFEVYSANFVSFQQDQ